MELPKFIKRSAMTGFVSLCLVSSMVLGAAAQDAPQASTPKKLSTNFTLVNLEAAANTGTIQYYKPDGSQWKAPEPFTGLNAQGDQFIKRQYTDPNLPSGSGSVVVSASGKLGAVVQVLAQQQTATSGAYSGATAAANTASIPLVERKLSTGSGVGNSQIVVQNAGTAATTVDIKLIKTDGTTQFTKSGVALAIGAAFNYDLSDEVATNVPDNFFGSAVVTAAAGGQIVAVSNLFSGPNGMQTFNAFNTVGQSWAVPLFAVRLANTLSTPVAVQNLSASAIPVGGIKLICTKDPASPGANFTASSTVALGPTASYFFNPVTDQTLPTGFFGACTVTTTGFDSIVFVQQRVVSGDQAAAYEGIKTDGTNKTSTIPLYAKRLANGFATSITIANLSSSAPANVSLVYKKSADVPATTTNCDFSTTAVIPAGGSLIQNLRLDKTGAGAVPQLGNGCFGTLVVKSSDSPIDAFVQLSDISGLPGDTLMAHDAFPSP